MGTQAPMTLPHRPSQRWNLNYVSDTLMKGRHSRILVGVDDFSRECLASVVDPSQLAARVARKFDTLIANRVRPSMIVSDNLVLSLSKEALR